MPGPRPLADEELRRRRTAAQHLHRPRPRTPAELVRHLLGVQAQVLSAAGLALRARTEGLRAEDVARALLEERSIVYTWAMRGTLHLVAAEDVGWLLPLVTRPGLANAHRRLSQEGVPAGQAARALGLIERMLKREGPLTRKEIAERLRRGGIRTEGQAIAHLMWLAAAAGVVCYGPQRGRDRCFVLVRDWVGAARPMETEAAMAELALRYLQAHGPAQPADLAYWAGIRLGDANPAWRSVQGQLATVETSRGPRWALRAQAEPAPAGLVRLLPAFDEFLLGWKDRDLVALPEPRTRINRGGGWIYPVLLADGRALGTWHTVGGPRALRFEISAFSDLPAAVRRGVAIEAKGIASFLGTSIELAPA